MVTLLCHMRSGQLAEAPSFEDQDGNAPADGCRRVYCCDRGYFREALQPHQKGPDNRMTAEF
eukprot:4883251-Prorocentrum_lima.AAC.1